MRPALVVQNDSDNARMNNTVVVQVTTNISRANLPTQLLIDSGHADWTRSGLKHPSVVNCSNIYTIEQADVAKVIGQLSKQTMHQVELCLKSVLNLS